MQEPCLGNKDHPSERGKEPLLTPSQTLACQRQEQVTPRRGQEPQGSGGFWRLTLPCVSLPSVSGPLYLLFLRRGTGRGPALLAWAQVWPRVRRKPDWPLPTLLPPAFVQLLPPLSLNPQVSLLQACKVGFTYPDEMHRAVFRLPHCEVQTGGRARVLGRLDVSGHRREQNWALCQLHPEAWLREPPRCRHRGSSTSAGPGTRVTPCSEVGTTWEQVVS